MKSTKATGKQKSFQRLAKCCWQKAYQVQTTTVCIQGSHSFTGKKSRAFPGLYRHPHEKFSRTFL